MYGFSEKRKDLMDLASKHGFRYIGSNPDTTLVSFYDDALFIRIDVYLSRMTVGVSAPKSPPKWHKKQSMESVEKIMKTVYKYV